MSSFTSLWRLWLGLALIAFFGVPVFTVLSWIVGGVFGFVLLGIAAIFAIGFFLAGKPDK